MPTPTNQIYEQQAVKADPSVQQALDQIQQDTARTYPSARVYHSVDQSIGNFSDTSLAFDTERFDTGSMHDTATNNSRLTANVAGVYMVWGGIRWASSGADNRSLWIARVGTQVSRVTFQNSQEMSVQTILYLGVGEYVELKVRQDSAGAINVTATTERSPEFAICFLQGKR